MRNEISQLLEISRFYGKNKDYVIAGGGNTSFKDENTLWIKSSGQSLALLDEDGLVTMDRKKLSAIASAEYPSDPSEREARVKEDLYAAITGSDKSKRPSVETSLHEIIAYRFVVHLHPTIANGLLCSRNARTLTQKIFGESVLFIPYTDPGYILFKKLEKEIRAYREKFNSEPKIIFLENHGVFVGADTTDEIRTIYSDIIDKIGRQLELLPQHDPLPLNPSAAQVAPGLRMLLSGSVPGVVRFRNNSLIAQYSANQQEFLKISHPLTPDIIVYCKTRYIFVDHSSTPGKILDSVRYQLNNFINEYGYKPRIIVIKDMGLFSVSDSYGSAETTLDVYEDLIKVSHYAMQMGGIKMMTPEQVAFIDNWEVENYRRKVSQAGTTEKKLLNKIAIVTGGGQGFGAGIAESLATLGANVAIADINEESGNTTVAKINSMKGNGRAFFIKTDVSDAASVKDMVSATVQEFGGLDLMISNAGILRAGGLDETNPETFSKSTEINYNGYFYCTKYASEVMKIQNQERPEYFSDIVQINSKSGLRGSNRNFSYAGAKFGGIGLTQSFALELAPNRIKVNAICPGNFYEGPLWSDPHNGLFVQYLKTGKVPGARTVDDVRKFYEDQVPMKRGCRLEDVMRALVYIIEQEYETGQAVPVTGGQVMLS